MTHPGIPHLRRTAVTVEYAELHAVSNFTFLRGASHPEELVETAAALDPSPPSVAALRTVKSSTPASTMAAASASS